jgi:protein-arginine kinase activator protein McsA
MKAKDIHKDSFDFSKVVYTTSRTPVEIKCTTCNTIYYKQPKHILQGVGCINCMYNAKRMDKIEFINKANAIHNNKYTYSNVQYTNNSTKVLIHCTKCNTSFKQSPINHLLGNGCPSCASSGFDPDKPAILYYLKIKHESSIYYKIGITNRTVNKRFSKDELKYITILNTINYDKGLNAFKEEQRLLSKYLKFKYDGPTVLNSGHTELLTSPILELE